MSGDEKFAGFFNGHSPVITVPAGGGSRKRSWTNSEDRDASGGEDVMAGKSARKNRKPFSENSNDVTRCQSRGSDDVTRFESKGNSNNGGGYSSDEVQCVSSCESEPEECEVPKSLYLQERNRRITFQRLYQQEKQKKEKATQEVSRLVNNETNLKVKFSKLKEQFLSHLDMHLEMEKLNVELQKMNLQYQKELRKDANVLSSSSPSSKSKSDEFITVGSVEISKIAVDFASCRPKDSLFVKDLAVFIWGNDALKDRSVTGKPSPCTPKDKQVQRMALTPQKVHAIEELYRQRLEAKGCTSELTRDSVKSVRRWLAEKISDLRRENRYKMSPELKNLEPECIIGLEENGSVKYDNPSEDGSTSFEL